jgi:hypothetical protein
MLPRATAFREHFNAFGIVAPPSLPALSAEGGCAQRNCWAGLWLAPTAQHLREVSLPSATLSDCLASLSWSTENSVFSYRKQITEKRDRHMTHKLLLVLAISIFALGTTNVSADEAEKIEHEQIVIALSTDDFELAETDLSDLEVGDAETIMTESGKRIDLLRTEDGVEVYVDGELVDTGMHGGENLHDGHTVVHKHVEVICDTDEDCEEMVWMSEDEEFDMESLHEQGHHEKVIIIKKEADSD